MGNDRNRRPPTTDIERWDHLSPRQLALGTHADVHGIRKQFLEALEESQRAVLNAVESSQTALMNRLGLIEKEIAKLGTGSGGDVVTESDKALMAASRASFKPIADRLKALNARTT